MIIQEVKRIIEDDGLTEEDACKELDFIRSSNRWSLDKLYKVLKAEKIAQKRAAATENEGEDAPTEHVATTPL